VVYANQQTNGGNWSLLGRFNFNAGTSNSVTVLDNFSDTGSVTVADGVKLAYASADIILDNTSSQVAYSGSWTSGNSATGAYQTTYDYASTSPGGTYTATYTPNFPNAGYYDIYVRYPASSNRATNAPWLVSYQGGSTNVIVNQQVNGGGWQVIAAARPFLAGTNGYVQLSNNAGPGVVIADAVKFVFAGPLAPISFQSFAVQPGGVKMLVTSTPGYPFWVDRSTNFGTWLPFASLLSSNGLTTVTDVLGSASATFYRGRQ
jgi:hypothetical protein